MTVFGSTEVEAVARQISRERDLSYGKTTMEMTQEGIDLIKRWEGFRAVAYQDIVGVWTIGYGHTAAAGDPVPVEGMAITKRDGEAILRRDLWQYEAAVREALDRPASDNQYSAMVSLCFNIGPGAFKSSTMVRRFNAGDIIGAAEALAWFNKAGGKRVQGLVNRRDAERRLFLKPGALE